MKGASGSVEVMSYKAALMSPIKRSKSVSPKLKHTDTLIRVNNLCFSSVFDTRPIGDFTMSITIFQQSDDLDHVWGIGSVRLVRIDGEWMPEFYACSDRILDPDINGKDLKDIIGLAYIQANKLFYGDNYIE
jgi:hypothetical protein